MQRKEYEIGYKKPPRETRFRKGCSGNPSGRPKGSQNTIKLLEELLNQKISVLQDGKKRKISKKTAIMMQMVNAAVKGDPKSVQTLLPYMTIIDNKNEEKETAKDNLSKDDKEIITNFLKDCGND